MEDGGPEQGGSIWGRWGDMVRFRETQDREAVGFLWLSGKHPGVGAGARGVRSDVCTWLTLMLSCGTWRLKWRGASEGGGEGTAALWAPPAQGGLGGGEGVTTG